MTEHQARVVFVGPDPLPALGSGLAVICADGCGIAQAAGPSWQGYPAPGVNSSSSLLALPAVRDRLRTQADAIVVWKSSAQLESIAKELGVLLANSPALISRRLENKSHFSNYARSGGLPIPPTKTGIAGPALLRAARVLSPPFVFQLAHGFSGAHTYPADSQADLEHLVERFRGRSCRISVKVSGIPATVTGVISADRLLIGPACIQLTGIPSLTPHPLGSCGNDYGRPVPEEREILRLALLAAKWLRDEGHRGVFGLDVVVGEDGSVWCIELNPRLVASVPLFSLSARDLGTPGILSHHLASFGVSDTQAGELSCHWSQLILYQRAERLPGDGSGTSRGTLSTSDRFTPTGELGLGGPRPGEAGLLIQAQSRPGKELARVIFEGSCSTPDGALLPIFEAAVAELRARLEGSGGDPSVS